MRLVTDPADFLGTPHRFVSNFSLVNDTLNYLTPANSVIFIGSQKFNFNGSSRLPVSQQGAEPVPWPSQLTMVCYNTVPLSGLRFLLIVIEVESVYVHSMCIYYLRHLFWYYTNINHFFFYQFEPIYGTPYQETNLSSGLVNYWRTDDDATASLHLPGINQFLPNDLNVLKAPDNVSKIPVEIPIDSKYDHRYQENSATSSIPSLPTQTILVSRCGGCRTQSSVSLVSTSTAISTHQMLRTLQLGLVGSETTMHNGVSH